MTISDLGIKSVLWVSSKRPLQLHHLRNSALQLHTALQLCPSMIYYCRSVMIRKRWFSLHWSWDSVRQGEPFTLKLSWDNSHSFNLFSPIITLSSFKGDGQSWFASLSPKQKCTLVSNRMGGTFHRKVFLLETHHLHDSTLSYEMCEKGYLSEHTCVIIFFLIHESSRPENRGEEKL